MVENERASVGETLDVIRGALTDYVDAAMTTAYGASWHDVVADDDAKRRSSGRKYPVSKADLAVMLKVLIHRRVEPWSRSETHPQARAYASELLNVRNLHAHGNDCVGEHTRLLDTGRRLLTTLDIPIPAGLSSAPPSPIAVAIGDHDLAVVPPSRELSRWDAEMSNVSESGKRLEAVIQRSSELETALASVFSDWWHQVDPGQSDVSTLTQRLKTSYASAGSEVCDLLETVDQVIAEEPTPVAKSTVVLALAARCLLLSDSLANAVRMHTANLQSLIATRLKDLFVSKADPRTLQDAKGSWTDTELKILERRVAQSKEWTLQSADDRWRNLASAAAELEDSNPLGNAFIALANLRLAKKIDGSDEWRADALPRVRTAIAHLRFEAASDPGSSTESLLVDALRLEGRICSDLGLSEDAVIAFARADETVARYPAADPQVRR